MSPLLLEHGDPIRLKPMTKDEKMCFVSQDGSMKMLDIDTDKDGNPLIMKVKDVLFKCVSRGNMWCKMYFLMLLQPSGTSPLWADHILLIYHVTAS